MRWHVVALAIAAAALAGCGDDRQGETATTPPLESAMPSNLIDGQAEIVIKTYADLQSVVDTGKVLDGSSLGDSSFCPEGSFTGGHGNTDNGWLDKTFDCPDGTLTIAFDPRNNKKRSASGPWEILSGTDAYQGMEGSGRFEIEFPADPTVMTGHETFTGTVSQ